MITLVVFKMTEVFIPVDDGRWVSEEYERLAQVIRDYDPHLGLRWIPPEHRTREDKEPYCIVDTTTNYVVLYASELDTPVSILAKLWGADNARGNVLVRIDAQNAAQQALDMRKQMDKMEDAHDLAKFLWQSPLNFMKHNGIKFDDQRRRIK